MSSSTKDRLVPPDDVRCIWMTAGILSYWLCDRKSDCDDCPLDAAMRKHFSRQSEAGILHPEGHAECLSVREPLRAELLYSRNHCWIRPLDARSIRVGVEPGLGLAVLDPKAVVFPSAGQSLQKGQTFLWVVMEGGTLPMDSPCSGTVRQTNRQLAGQPHLLHLRSFDEGWLFELESEDLSMQQTDLLSADRASPIFGEDEACFLRYLSDAMHGNRPQVGATLADGGHRLQSLAEALGPAKYFSILRKVYGA